MFHENYLNSVEKYRKKFLEYEIYTYYYFICKSFISRFTKYKIRKIEYIYFNNVINKIHNILKYGEGYPDDLFIDELEKRREGHCGHFSLFFFRELIMHDYSVEIINITTFDNRIHTVVQVKLKSSDRYIVVDPTSKIIYKNSIGELIANLVYLTIKLEIVNMRFIHLNHFGKI